MKTMKFREALSRFVLNGEKNVTWRLFDDKNISKGDIVSFAVWETGKEFAKAKITSVVEKKFSEMKASDFDGHEKFSSDKEMYETYSKYYNREVNGETIVKIIKFELI